MVVQIVNGDLEKLHRLSLLQSFSKYICKNYMKQVFQLGLTILNGFWTNLTISCWPKSFFADEAWFNLSGYINAQK